MTLRLLTLNVKGMASPTKRHLVLTYLRSIQADFLCLQETHAPESGDECDFWQRIWGPPAAWTPHVGVLCSRATTLLSSCSYADGRILHCHLRIRGVEYSLVNMYAPAHAPQRHTFFASLSSLPIDFSSLDFIVGDWNDVPDMQRNHFTQFAFPLLTGIFFNLIYFIISRQRWLALLNHISHFNIPANFSSVALTTSLLLFVFPLT